MKLHLAGQQVAVFGSSSGIGRAIAQAFATEGCVVRGFDRIAPADAVPFETSLGDVTSLAQISEFAAAFPAIDHVVFSVGVGSGKFGFRSGIYRQATGVACSKSISSAPSTLPMRSRPS